VEGPTIYRLYLPPGLKLMLVIMALGFFMAGIFIISLSLLSNDKNAPPLLFDLFFLAAIVGNALWILSIPHQISLSKEGIIEFKSVLRRRVIKAIDVKSIKPAGFYYGFVIVRATQTKVRLFPQFDGFHDFLVKLKAMNPQVELRGC
jgi:hypothetical protein